MFLAIAMLAATQDRGVTGFVCTSPDGGIRRFNIDLRRNRFDAGDGAERINHVTDATIILRGANPDLVAGVAGMGPVISSLELDRMRLVLTDQTLIPERNVNRTTRYQCEAGEPIDFKAGRKF